MTPHRPSRPGRRRALASPLPVLAGLVAAACLAARTGLDLLAVGLIATATGTAVVAVRRRGRSTPRRALSTVLVGVLGLAVALAVLGIRSNGGPQPLLTVLQQAPRPAGPPSTAPSPRAVRRHVLERVPVRTTHPAAAPATSPTPPRAPGRNDATAPPGRSERTTAFSAQPAPGRTMAARTTVTTGWRWVLRETRSPQEGTTTPAASTTAPQEVLSFVSPDEDGTSSALERDAELSTDLAVTGAVLGPGGTVQGVPSTDTLIRAHAHAARGLLVVSNYDAATDDMNGPAAAALLRDQATRSALVVEIARTVTSAGWDGAVIDLEALPADTASALVDLVTGVKAALGERKVVVSTPAGDAPGDLAGYDLGQLAAAADRIDWMAYDQNTASGDAGPVAGLGWVRGGLALALRQVPAGKLLLGVAGYGYLWPAEGSPRELDWTALQALAHTPGAQVVQDQTEGELTVHLPDGGTAWFEDSGAIARRAQLVGQDHLAGVALWRVGSEDPATLGSLPARPVKAVGLSTDGRPVVRVATTGLVALTFDDGPDPIWTPRILDVLRREQVPATFFVVGRQALANPGVLTAEVDAGNVVGNHTFSHPDVNAVSTWRARLEIRGNQAVIDSVIGHRPLLYRSPYGNGDRVVGAKTRDDLAGSLGLQPVGWTNDSLDWSRPGVDRIVSNVMAGAAPLTVILLHDGGGDRSQTVAALPIIIERLRAAGYQFVTVPALNGATASAYTTPHSKAQQFRWTAEVAAVRLVHGGLLALGWIALAVALLSLLRLLVGGPLALVHAWLARRHDPLRSTKAVVPRADPLPTVSVLIPAHNEEKVIGKALAALAALRGADRPLEAIVVDDGSTDGTAELVRTVAAQGNTAQVSIRLLQQARSGKAAALNTGIGAARGEVVVVIDADTVVTADLCRAMAVHFLDPSVGAVAGNVKVGNRHRLLALLQAAEYVTSLNLDRRGQAVLNTIAVVPGAAGAFRRSALLAVGGYPTQTLVEDADLTTILLRAGWRIPYEPRAVVWTEAPERFRDALKQRRRWSYGTLQVLARHADVIGRPRYGALGLAGMPWNLVSQILLPALAPLVELYLVFRLLTGDTGPVVQVLALAAALDVVMVAMVTLAERENWRLVAVAPLLRWVWRPLQLISVLLSFHRWLRAEEHRWSPSRRYATVTTPAGPVRPGHDPADAPSQTGAVPEDRTAAVPLRLHLHLPGPEAPQEPVPPEPVSARLSLQPPRTELSDRG